MAAVAVIFSYSQSDVAFAKRMSQSRGFLRFTPTAPAWMRRSLPLNAGESLAVWFDTPVEFFVGTDVSLETLRRAAEIDTLRWVVFDSRRIDERHVAAFQGHSTIKGLRLANTQVTDRIFPILDSFPQLAFVSLSGTNVSPEGLAAFRERHPTVEVDVDPITASGLLKVAKGRAAFSDEHGEAGTLTLRGPIDDELLTVVNRLPVRQLVLEGIDADHELTALAETQRIDYLELRGGSLQESFARAISRDHLTTIDLSDIKLTRAAAEALAASPLTWIRLGAVTCEPQALASLLNGKQVPFLVLDGLDLTEDDAFEAEAIGELEVQNVRFLTTGSPFGGASIERLTLRNFEAEGALWRDLVKVPTRSLHVFTPALRGEVPATWPASIRADGFVALAGMSLSPDEAKSLAAAPADQLSLARIEWRKGAAASFTGSAATGLTIDHLLPDLARALEDSAVEQLYVLEAASGAAMAELGRLKRLKQLSLHVTSTTPEQIKAVADAPSLEELNLWLLSPPSFPIEIWRDVAESHPHLRLNASVNMRLPDVSVTKRLWPE